MKQEPEFVCPHCKVAKWSEEAEMIGDPEYNDMWKCEKCHEEYGTPLLLEESGEVPEKVWKNLTTNTEEWEKEFDAFCRDVFLLVAKPSSGADFNWAQTELKSFIRNLITKTEADTLERVREIVQGRIYVFERDKEDYLPEVYKHLKSKNEALTDLIKAITPNQQ